MNKKTKTKRRFIFIDESGDPGFSSPDSSEYFQINVALIDDISLPALEREFTLYKYFMDHYKELKTRINIKNHKIRNLLTKISEIEGVSFYTHKVNKSEYDGPNKSDSTKFRNFILKRVLQNIDEISKEKDLFIEIVIDKYLNSETEENNLKKYLNDKYKNLLPRFISINQVDSRYCHPIQILDALGTFTIKGELSENVFTEVDIT